MSRSTVALCAAVFSFALSSLPLMGHSSPSNPSTTGNHSRPDGKELAFSSSHLNVVSLYQADIYAIGPDGKGYRKITNSPDQGELGRYPKGVVTVTVRNEQPVWKQSQASSGVFFVYVVGADEPQAVTLPPGSSKTLVFKSVADYGSHAQGVVAMYGTYRWFIPGLDVRAGQATKAPDFSITGDGIELFGAFHPTWRADGSRLSYRSGLCVTSTIPAQPTPGEFVFKPLFSGEQPSGACTWDWGPSGPRSGTTTRKLIFGLCGLTAVMRACSFAVVWLRHGVKATNGNRLVGKL